MAKLTDDYIRKMAQDYTYNPKYNDPGTGEALEELLVLREKIRWIPVTERLPGEFLEVLILTEHGYMLVCRVDGEWIATQGNHVNVDDCEVTHWMSLPEIPEVAA